AGPTSGSEPGSPGPAGMQNTHIGAALVLIRTNASSVQVGRRCARRSRPGLITQGRRSIALPGSLPTRCGCQLLSAAVGAWPYLAERCGWNQALAQIT